MSWAATRLARSQLVERAGGPYSGSTWDCASSLIPAINHIINIIFDYASRIFQKNFVFKFNWVLLVFAFRPDQKTGFEASEHNIDASHTPTARKLALYALHTIRAAAFLARASLKRVFLFF